MTAKYGYALDSDGKVGTIIVAAPTQAKVRATIYGKTAHAGVAPEKASLRLRLHQKRSRACRLAVLMKKQRRISAALKAEHKRILSVIK